jgi:uncharacterized membrane-anchored protein
MPKETTGANWKKVLGALAETLTKKATDSIVELTKHSISQISAEKNRLIDNFKRMVMSAGLMVIGVVFLLVGIAVVINEYFRSHNSIGYILVGLVAMVAGLAIGRKK